MTPESQRLVQEAWALLAPHADAAARAFYDRLFETDPDARALFAKTDMAEQRRKLVHMFDEIVRVLGDPERFVPDLAALGRRHVGYGTRDLDYDSVGAALLHTLDVTLGDAFTAEHRAAWAEAYRIIAGVMRRAAARVPGSTAEYPVPRPGMPAAGQG